MFVSVTRVLLKSVLMYLDMRKSDLENQHCVENASPPRTAELRRYLFVVGDFSVYFFTKKFEKWKYSAALMVGHVSSLVKNHDASI